MSLNIEAAWSKPIGLKIAKWGAIYECKALDEIPSCPGVYIFGLEHGDAAAPLYIGKALNLRRRIEQQLNSVKLMKGILEAQIGGRFVIYCTPLKNVGCTIRKAPRTSIVKAEGPGASLDAESRRGQDRLRHS